MSISERGNETEVIFTINYLELLAIFHAVRAFCSDMKHIHVSVQSNLMSAIAYVNHMGGIASFQMDQLALELW